jgi:ribonuclease BN (tRNA processing enzyme)
VRLVLLGTGGGPRPTTSRFPTSQAIVVGERVIVVDCGNGVAKQLVGAGLSPRDVSDVLVTHHHVDHSADLGYLPVTSWIEGRTDDVHVWGPPPTVGALTSLFDGYQEDFDKRQASTGRPPFRQMITGHDITAPGLVLEDDEVRVTAAFVDHPPFEIALAYRIDTADGSVVLSGDTAPSENLVELARGADVLVHEVVHPEGVVRMGIGSSATTIAQHMRRNHTMVEDLRGIAQRAGVGTLVLSHLVPHDLPDEEWLAALGDEFTGEVIVGADLMSIDVSPSGPATEGSSRRRSAARR